MEKNEFVDPGIGTEEESESSFSFRNIYTMFVLNWGWFLMSLIIFVCGALIYLRYTDPQYSVSAKLLVKDESGNSGNQMLSNMQDLGFISNSTGIDNEIEILQSHILAREAVRNLKLYTEYKMEGRVKKSLIYKTQPLSADLDPEGIKMLDEIGAPIEMKISKNGAKYEVEGMAYSKAGVEKPFHTVFDTLPASVSTYAGVITFTKNTDIQTFEDKADEEEFMTKDLFVTISPLSAVTNAYVGATTVEATSKSTTIALLTTTNKSVQRAEDYLLELADCYNRQANADKNEIAVKTEEFINERLSKINVELGETENEIELYKKSHSLTEITLDAEQRVSQTTAYSDRLSEIEAQIQLLDYLREYVNDSKNKYQIIPSNVGLSDNASTSLIDKYNEAVMDRNRLLRSASEIAPQVQTLTQTLDQLQNSIKTALLQARHSADIQRMSVQKQLAQYNVKVSSTPEQEKILTQIGRQQEVKSGLYLLLLEKREENSISLAATADKGKLIDDPIFEGKVSPKTLVILVVAIVLGIGLPLGILMLSSLMRYRIEGHDDVVTLTSLPIIADVAVASDTGGKGGIVVHENTNDQIDEIFRSMRTNIQFMLKESQKIIMFTSSTSGEGKTFNAVNLAVSFALLGKKVILIGLDIRKPALAKLFEIEDRKTGITNLLRKDVVTKDVVRGQIMPSGVNDNLDLMPAGPTPPNPTELIARENLGQVFACLKEMYDYIIVDTAPVGLVTDTLLIGAHADVTIVVCRADYTPKVAFLQINSLVAEGKIKNPCVVLNGVDMSKKKYGYYYGYGKYGKYGRYGAYGRYGRYGRYGSYGSYGSYGNYGSYGRYNDSHYSNKDDSSIKTKKK